MSYSPNHQQKGYAATSFVTLVEEACDQSPPRNAACSATQTGNSNSIPLLSTDFRPTIRFALDDSLDVSLAFDVDWNTVYNLLEQLESVKNHQPTHRLGALSVEDDPFGRLFVSKLLSRNPPVSVLDAALKVFPDSLSPSNPAAFFTASQDATPEIVGRMIRHVVDHSNTRREMDAEGNDDTHNRSKECPYPWIFSPFISLEAAQEILQTYPQGVWHKPSSSTMAFLSADNISYCPLDYVLLSSTMVERRTFDESLWGKFKLVLVAAEVSSSKGGDPISCGISPVHTILERILIDTDFFEDLKKTQHVLWMLRQLCASDIWVFEKRRGFDGASCFAEENGLFPLHCLLLHQCTASSHAAFVAARELCKILLEAYPGAARYRFGQSGLYPLHVAIQNGWPCHDLLLSVFPESLELPDPRTGLFPFQTASLSSSAMDATANFSNLDVTFELLRAHPAIAGACGDTVHRSNGMIMDTSGTDPRSTQIQGMA
mmetsp:Transcript_27922/g.52332  ORF Transcript_27922/g.52332 Transcript_27922/m.52332 type:complete len:488 (-) Transcript_27922:3165-4628(-)